MRPAAPLPSRGPRPAAATRRALLLAALAPAACAPRVYPAGPATLAPGIDADALVMADGARLPLRAWLPAEGPPRAAVLALHGFNESRNFVEEPAGALAAAGVALYSYDQRGFGRAPNRGTWAGTATLAADAAAAARLVRSRHPGVPLLLLGESMGAAVAMVAATSDDPPPVEGLVLLAPAVWGRGDMPPLMRGLLDLLAHTIPVVAAATTVPGLRPTDDAAALARLSRDPLTIRETRVDAVWGLVDLMDAAVAAAPRLGLPPPGPGGGAPVPALFVYGGRDALVPPAATRRMLRSLPEGAPNRVAYYPRSFHLVLRDRNAPAVLADVLAWIARPGAPLPSGAEAAAAAWLAPDAAAGGTG